MRLIDADALKLNAWPERYTGEGIVYVEDIDNAPTVEAVEVVHGRWDTVFYERNGTLASYSHICTKCKYFYRDVHFKGHNYRPNCGADMRGDGNDNM